MPIGLDSLLGWVAQHPYWATASVFLVASAESLAIVGLVVPGAAVMIAAGALIALGMMAFWPVLLAAVAGAIVGDGISFWIGRRYRAGLRSLWPLCRHPQWLSRGERYFHRHGGKSVLFGRFVGPVRPVVPLVAGMLGMKPAAFVSMNVLSAIAWAPVYLLPGMAFGASLALAGVVAARLTVLLVLLAALAWLVLSIVRWLFRVLSPRAGVMARSLLSWGSRHRWMNQTIRGLLDPSQPELKTLVIMATLLIGAAWLFLGVLEDVVAGDPLVRADRSLYQLLAGLRTPWADQVMVLVTELGDGFVIASVGAAVLARLSWCRNWGAAGYWTAAIGFGQLAATAIKLVLKRPRPFADLYSGLSTYAFPSGHATMSVVVYGFLAVLVAGTFRPQRRWLAYAAAALLIFAIAVSRLYLGAHWLSDVVGGLSLGLAWVCLLAIAYHRHPRSVPVPHGLPGVALLALALAGGWHAFSRYSADLQRYAPRMTVQHLPAASWWQEDWRRLPAYRQDLEGEFEQPLNVQWTGTLPSVRAKLHAHGWHEPVPLSATTALHWLRPAPSVAELPLLPQVHDGRHEALLMLGPTQESPAQERGRQLVLRLWTSGVVLDPDGLPLWVGSVSLQEAQRILFLTLPVAEHEYGTAVARLMQSLSDVEIRVVRRGAPDRESRWSGTVLLMRSE